LSSALILLRELGARGEIAVERVEYVFGKRNPPFARLTAALGRT